MLTHLARCTFHPQYPTRTAVRRFVLYIYVFLCADINNSLKYFWNIYISGTDLEEKHMLRVLFFDIKYIKWCVHSVSVTRDICLLWMSFRFMYVGWNLPRLFVVTCPKQQPAYVCIFIVFFMQPAIVFCHVLLLISVI